MAARFVVREGPLGYMTAVAGATNKGAHRTFSVRDEAYFSDVAHFRTEGYKRRRYARDPERHLDRFTQARRAAERKAAELNDWDASVA